MKRLKYSCLFYGHFYIVFAIFLLSPFAGVLAQVSFYHKLDTYSLNVILLSAWGIANVLILVLFAWIFRIPKPEERLLTTAILLGDLTLILIAAHLQWLFWHRITEDAVYAGIPVHHCFTRTVYGRRHMQINHYMVCYLPNGKYVLNNDGLPTDPQTVHIVKYRGFFRCIPQISDFERTNE